jgi:hypothetical protein
MAKLSKEELQRVNELVNEFNVLKVKLGDTVITQNSLLKDIEALRLQYAEEEKKLVEKYGVDSTINVQTGEITKKE